MGNFINKKELEHIIHSGFNKESWTKVYNFIEQNSPWSIERKIKSPFKNELSWYEKEANENYLISTGNMLELGSHWGRFCFYKRETTNMSIIGADVSNVTTEHANGLINKYNLDNIKFVVMFAEDIQFPNNHFDVVYAFETLEHVGNLDVVLTEIHRVLKPNCSLIFSLPLENHNDGGFHTQKHSKNFWISKFSDYFKTNEILDKEKDNIIIGKLTK